MLDAEKLHFLREHGWYSVSDSGVLWRHDDRLGNYMLAPPEDAYEIELARNGKANRVDSGP